MARDDGGASAPAPAPAPGQVYPPAAWQRTYDRLVKLLRKVHEEAEDLCIENKHLITEIQFLKSNRRERDEISGTHLKQICKEEERRMRAAEAEMEARLSNKDFQIDCCKKAQQAAEDDLKDFKICVLDLNAEINELKEKLKKFESQEEISTGNSYLQKSGKDIREEIRKLKEAYKILRSEKDMEISVLKAEKDFVWDQFKNMESDYSRTIKNKNIEVKQATEAAQKLLQNVDELQVEAQKKDDEIARDKERISILEDELQKLRSLVNGKDPETAKNAETSRMSKKDTNKGNRKSTSTSRVTPDMSTTSHVTPDRREVKTIRTRASETNQKRKRNSVKSSLSCGNQRCYIRPLQTKVGVSPMLLPPNFTFPRLKTPTPS